MRPTTSYRQLISLHPSEEPAEWACVIALSYLV